jgi:hypothetical protein
MHLEIYFLMTGKINNLKKSDFILIKPNCFSIPIKNLSYSTDLLKMFKTVQYKRSMQMEWNVPADTFPLVSKAIVIESLQNDILLGFIFSIGAMTESVVKASTKSFIKELQELHTKKKSLFITLIKNLLRITKENIKNDRLSASLVKTVDLIIQFNLFNDQDLMNE